MVGWKVCSPRIRVKNFFEKTKKLNSKDWPINEKGLSQRKLCKKFNLNQSKISLKLAKMKIHREKTHKYNQEKPKAQKAAESDFY